MTTNMWTETYIQTSYIKVTVHYITDNWALLQRVITTCEFAPDLCHTGTNIKQAVHASLAKFDIDTNKAVFVTDRGTNNLAAMKDSNHISCCNHTTYCGPLHRSYFGRLYFGAEGGGGPSVAEFWARVEQLNDRMTNWMGERHDTYYWRH